MRRYSNSNTLFNQFSSNYQKISPSHQIHDPFVYVDNDGNVKLLTNVLESDLGEDGIFAVSVAQDGWMEFLAINNT